MCLGCTYANWNRTATGRLHPSGDGRCAYPWKMPPLPMSMYWLGQSPPRPLGGNISRKEELGDHCAYFLRKEKP